MSDEVVDRIKKGLIFLGPLSFNKTELSYMVDRPPIPDPIITPDLDASLSSFIIHPEFLIASSAAINE